MLLSASDNVYFNGTTVDKIMAGTTQIWVKTGTPPTGDVWVDENGNSWKDENTNDWVVG